MAENVLETRILLRYDTYSNWMNSEVILKAGEAAIAVFPYNNTIITSDNRPTNTPPAIGIKIGDGEHYFYELPWVQAVAADVHSWAKSSTKPSYSAQEIFGLQNFVENLINGDVNVTIAPRIYSIVQGTGENANKYYLQYKENTEESNWILDTSTSIDLTNLVSIINWIGNDLTEYQDLAERTEEHIQYDLNRLKVTDSEEPRYFITSVSQNKGKISTTKKLLSFSDINETLNVSQGGTGHNNLTDNNVLVGNGTDPIKLIPIADTIANNNYLVPNYLIKSYVDNATSGITGAMHFIGEATVVINNNSNVNPQIPEYNFSQAKLGDVILYDAKEFVWTGGNWRLLGDEGSYAIKGSIRDIDIDADAAIQQSKIDGLNITFNSKVDKVEGKTLTSNDFTDELKQKLDNIQEGATRNNIEHILLNGTEIRPTTVEQTENAINLEIQEFNEEAQNKLNGIEENAQVNKIEKIIFDGVEITPNESKTISIVSDPHILHENKIEQIFINGIEWEPNQDKQVQITLDQAALNLNVLEGAQIPNGNTTEEIEQINKKLQLARIAATGNIKDLSQSQEEYITLYCGSSTQVI